MKHRCLIWLRIGDCFLSYFREEGLMLGINDTHALRFVSLLMLVKQLVKKIGVEAAETTTMK